MYIIDISVSRNDNHCTVMYLIQQFAINEQTNIKLSQQPS